MPVNLINPRLGARLIDENLSEVDIVKYSAFKHGRSSIAVEYAGDIFDRCLSQMCARETLYNVVLSPATYLPTASHSIAIALHELMQARGYRTRLTNIRRNCTYTVDYGMMTAEQRLALIRNDDFSLEERFAPEDQLLFVDDVSISGAHQHVVESMLRRQQVENRSYFLYYAVAADKEVDSRIEGLMNQALVKEIKDLPQLMGSPDFILNTRVVKLLLNSDELTSDWLECVPSNVLREIVVGARGNQYDELAEYARNFQIIEQSWEGRKSASIH